MDKRDVPGSGPSPDPGSVPGTGGGPVMDSDADTDFDEWAAWLDREIAAGRNLVPPERAPEPQGISVCLGDAEGIDPELFAAISGTNVASTSTSDGGRTATGLGPQFGQDAAADVMPPGPALAALTEAAVDDVTRLSDDQLVGVLPAARRQENREAWKKTLVIAEFARRRETEFREAEARGVPVHCRPGQFPGEELAMELLAGPVQTSHAIDDATNLTTRLPRTLAGMAAGLIDEARAGVIALYTRSLSPDDTALADDILAALAPTVRLDQLARKAAALEMKLAPEAVKARKEHARLTRQRVEIRREESGNASVAGREMDTCDALDSKAHIHALALGLRRAGMPGTLDQLRLMVFADLTAGRDPLNRLTSPRSGPASANQPDLNSHNPNAPAQGGRRDAAAPAAPTDPAAGDGYDDWVSNDAQVLADDRVQAGDQFSGDVHPPRAPAQAGTEIRDDAEAGGQHARNSAKRPPEDNEDLDLSDIPPPETPSEGEGEMGGTSETGGQRRFGPATGHIDGNPTSPGSSSGPGGGSVSLDYRQDDCGSSPHVPDPDPRLPAPTPAMINLVVHAGTLFGWDTTPTEAGGWGLLDADETRAIVEAASKHPATRWCLTLVGRDGTAAAHGCAPGRHLWTPHNEQDPTDGHDQPDSTGAPRQQHGSVGTADSRRDSTHPPGSQGPVSSTGFIRQPTPTPAQAARLASFLRGLNPALEPIAKGECGHVTAELRYTPSRKLTHLVRARTATCDAPGCTAQAVHTDLDHTRPYPEGPTDQCNLGPKCRRHHKTKQAPGWKVEQPEPGVFRWTLPSSRTHTTKPTVYGIVEG